MKYRKKEIAELAQQAIARFDANDEEGFFRILDRLTCSKPAFDVIRAFGSALGRRALTDTNRYLALFDKIMHREREYSYNPNDLSDFLRKSEKNIDALVYGGRTAIIGSAFTQIRENHWEYIIETIERYNTEFADWYVVDTWCHNPMAHIIAEHQDVAISRFHKWSQSDNEWFRKAVPVYLHAFFSNYTGHDISPYIEILDRLMLDQSAWVAKGMGWCLREMAKNYQKELVLFLRKWTKVKGVKKLIYREANKKLDKKYQVYPRELRKSR